MTKKIAIYWKLREINEAKRSLIQTKEGLYLIDHSDNEDLKIDEKNQEVTGFQVKTIINTEGLLKNKIEEIKNEYNNGRYEKTSRGFESWLERNGYSERLSNSDSIDAEVRESVANNAGLDSKALQRESLGEPSVSSSEKDFRESTLSKTGSAGEIFSRVIEIPTPFFILTGNPWESVESV